MNNIGEHTVPYAAIRDIVETPGATRRLGADLNAIITRAGTNDDLTMREADAIRQAYGKLAKSTTFDAITKSNFQRTRDLFGERIATTSDAYREALNNFTLGMRRVEGVEVGQSAAGKTVRDVQATVNQPASGGASFGTLDPATAAARAGARQEGISQGRISDLAGRAEESAAGAVRVADELRQPGAVDRTAATVSPQRAEQLRELGELETQSATNLNSLDIRRATMQNPSAEVRNAISLIPVIRGRASAGFEAGLIGQGVKYLKKLGIPPNAAERMARDLTSGDPARIETMLKNIERLGVRDDAILELATQMAATQTGAKVSKSDTDQAVADLVANGYTEAAAKRLVGETNRAISGQ